MSSISGQRGCHLGVSHHDDSHDSGTDPVWSVSTHESGLLYIQSLEDVVQEIEIERRCTIAKGNRRSGLFWDTVTAGPVT